MSSTHHRFALSVRLRPRRRGWAIVGLLAVLAALPLGALAAWTSAMSTLMH